MNQLIHFYTVAYDTFGHLGLSLVIVALLLLPVAAFYFFFKVRQLDRWEQDLLEREAALGMDEQTKDVARARVWAAKFPEFQGLTREQLIEALPNTSNPVFLDLLFSEFNHVSAGETAAQPAPNPALDMSGLVSA